MYVCVCVHLYVCMYVRMYIGEHKNTAQKAKTQSHGKVSSVRL